MEKVTTAQRLEQIMRSRNIRQVDILQAAIPYCNLYNVRLSKTDLSQYVSGKVAPKQDKLTILGLALNVSEAWLMGYDVPQERTAKESAPNSEGGYNVIRIAARNGRSFERRLSDEQIDALIAMIDQLPEVDL